MKKERKNLKKKKDKKFDSEEWEGQKYKCTLLKPYSRRS